MIDIFSQKDNKIFLQRSQEIYTYDMDTDMETDRDTEKDTDMDTDKGTPQIILIISFCLRATQKI